MKNLRDTLETQIIMDAQHSDDTTVLASLLEMLTDDQVYQALSDGNQQHFTEPKAEQSKYPKTFDDIQDIVIPMVNEMVEDGWIANCTDTDNIDETESQDIIGRRLAELFDLDWNKLQD